MSFISNFLKKSFDKEIDGIGLAVFRIAYSLILLCEIAQMYYFRHLIFDKIPYIELSEINFAIPIGIWFLSVFFILFGAFTRFFSIINYLMSLILIGSIGSYEYHVFYAYMGVNFLLIFLPVSQCFSIDRLIQKLKYSNTTFQYNPSKKVKQLYYFLPVFVAVGLVYFDSIFVKLTANSWLHGLGMWMPSSFPMMVHNNLTFVLNNKIIMLFLGYLTLVFEALFIFLFFRKKFRIVMLIIGVGLHLGILITFPIPWFALIFISLYLLLVPVSFWQKVFKPKNGKATLKFYYDSECPLCVRTKIIISHFDFFNKIEFKTVQFDASEEASLKDIDRNTLLDDIHSVNLKGTVFSGVDTYIEVLKRIFYLYPISLLLRIPGIYHLAKKVYAYVALNRTNERCTEKNCGYNPPEIPNDSKIKLLQNYNVNDLKLSLFKWLIYSLSFAQLIIILNSPLCNKLYASVGFKNSKVHNYFSAFNNNLISITKPLLGLTSHNVFIDDIHYKGYSHIIAVLYKNNVTNEEVWLPIINKNGQPSYYSYGTNWRKVSFSMNNPNINLKILSSGVRDFTAFWAIKNGVDLKNATFLIKVKKIDTPRGWEKDFLNKQIVKPWIDGGFVQWKDNQFSSQIKDIESL
jgi:predicted DCC family thiol-disulfide oxidoreductase YuxK